MEINQLIGVPKGIVQQPKRPGALIEMLQSHPDGFVWKINDADKVHSDVAKLIRQIVVDKKFRDAQGNEWPADKIKIWVTPSDGQARSISNIRDFEEVFPDNGN